MPANSAASQTANVVVFVPGTTASALQNVDGLLSDAVWPNMLDTSLPVGESTRLLGLLSSVLPGSMAVSEIVSYLPTQPYPAMCYADLMNYFSTGSNFQDGNPFTLATYNTNVANNKATIAPASKLFYMVPYDWRQDNIASANWLNNALNYLDSIYGGKNYTFSILAHSMGGLVSRYVLENMSSFTTVNWSGKVQNLVTLATPHLGAPLAYAAILGEQISTKEAAGFNLVIQNLVNNSNYPSTFELLPPPSVNFLMQSGSPVSVYDTSNTQLAASYKAFGVNTGNLTTAQTFFNGLTDAAPPINYYFYYGDFSADQNTNAPTTVQSFNYSPARLHVLPSQTFIPVSSTAGDGVVPTSSASYTAKKNGATYTVTRQSFANYNHGQMGGCDMTNHPAAVVAAATAMGLNPVASAATAELQPA